MWVVLADTAPELFPPCVYRPAVLLEQSAPSQSEWQERPAQKPAGWNTSERNPRTMTREETKEQQVWQEKRQQQPLQ